MLTGHLAADAEVRHTPGGTMVTTLRVCVNTKEPNGVEINDWYRVALFSKQAEFAAGCMKGNLVQVVGRLKSNTYTAKDGSTKTSFEVNASEFMDLTPRPAGNQPPPQQRTQAAAAAPQRTADERYAVVDDDSSFVPF